MELAILMLLFFIIFFFLVMMVGGKPQNIITFPVRECDSSFILSAIPRECFLNNQDWLLKKKRNQ